MKAIKRARPGEAFEDSFRASIPRGVYVRRLRTPTSMGFVVPKLVELIGQLIEIVRRLRASLAGAAREMTLPAASQAGPDRMTLPDDGASAFIPEHWVEVCRICQGAGGAHASSCTLSIEVPQEVPEWVTAAARFRFTPKAGFDLLLTAPAFCSGPAWFLTAVSGPTPRQLAIQASILFALELKSVDGGALPFDNVDGDQEKALAEAAAAGHVACLVVEFRQAGEVWAIPIQVWQDIRLSAARKSLPLADARRFGMPIAADPERGASKPYWKVGDWLRQCGAAIPEPADAAEKKAAKKKPNPEEPEAPAAPGLFD